MLEPYEVKVSRTVWMRGKAGDNIKVLPIHIDERKKLTEIVIKNLEKDGLSWIKSWSSQCTPKNGTTDLPYSRGNKIKLMITYKEK